MMHHLAPLDWSNDRRLLVDDLTKSGGNWTGSCYRDHAQEQGAPLP